MTSRHWSWHAAGLVALMLSFAGPATAAQPGVGLHAPLPLPLEVVRGFAPPAQPFEAGRRGVEPVYAAAPGVVLYAAS